CCFFFSSRRRHTRSYGDWSSDVCSSDLAHIKPLHLARELQRLDMSAAALARKLGVPTNRVTQILNGTRSITGDTALRLGHFFGTSAQFWLNLQSLYDLSRAQEKAGRSIERLPRLRRGEPVYA